MSWIKGLSSGAIVFVLMSALAHADGRVIVDNGYDTDNDAKSITISADGHIVVGGSCSFVALDNSGTFAGPRSQVYACLRALAVRSDNLIIGVEQSIGHRPGIRMRAFNMFTGESGGEGYEEPDYLLANAIAFQPDDTRILLAGGLYFWPPLAGPGPYNDFFIMERYLTNAFQTDISFGPEETGRVSLGIQPTGAEYVSKLVVRSDGSVLAAGVTQVGQNAYDAVLALYDRDGFIKTSFGTNGVARVAGSSSVGMADMDSTGKIYVNAGGKLVTRLNSDGSLDTSFVSPDQTADITVGDIKVDTSGRAIIFGTTGSAAPYQGYIARLTPTGALDTSFGGGEVHLTAGQGVVTNGGFGALDGGVKPVLALTVAAESDPGVPPKTDVAVFRYTSGGTPDVSFGATQADADYYPDPFAFASKVVPAGSANVMSAPATITGIVGAAAISFQAGSAGSYVMECDSVVPRTGRISAGQTLCLTQDASSTPGESVETRVIIGGRVASFVTTSSAELADVVPDQFTFVDEPNVDMDKLIQSQTLTIKGLTGRAPATVTGGIIGCFTGRTINGVPMVANGDRICVFQQSSKVEGRMVSTVLTIGGVSDTFTSTVTQADLKPDAFAFESRTGVKLNDGVVSNTIRISGINRDVPVTVENGMVGIGCKGFTAELTTIRNGEELCVWHNSATQPNTSTTTTVRVGQGSATFTSTTAAASPPNSPGSDGGSGGGGAFDWFTVLGLAGLARRALRRAVR